MKNNIFIFYVFVFISHFSYISNTSKQIIKQKFKSLDESNNFLTSKIKINIEKKENLFFINEYSIPSDLINFLPTGYSFEILINQGRLPKIYKENYYVNSDQKINSKYEKHFSFYNDNILIDFPSGYIYHSNNFSPLDKNYSTFKNYFDIFTNVFKLSLNPILDRSNFIETKNNGLFFTDNNEKACTDHLDAIKEILPSKFWNEFLDKINYDAFVNSDYKSMKYFIKNDKDKFTIIFKIVYKIDYVLNYLNKIKVSDFKSQNENQNYLITSRYFQGITFNFDNLKYHTELKMNGANLKNLQIIDIIPDQLDILLSTIKIELYFNTTIFVFKEENLNYAFDINIVEGIEEQNPVVPFTYENKKSIKINFKLKENFIHTYLGNINNPNDKITIKISYELRKRLLNFESYENESEYGYKFPCGIIIFNERPIPTNHIYFNIPNIDGTMPFNIIALTWVIFGFMFIQILNMFIIKGNDNKSLLQKLKDRFMAKWGFLFGR